MRLVSFAAIPAYSFDSVMRIDGGYDSEWFQVTVGVDKFRRLMRWN